MPTAGHSYSVPDAHSIGFLRPDCSPSLTDHAVAESAFATGDVSTDYLYQYASLFSDVHETSFDDEDREVVETRFLMSLKDAPSTAIAFQEHTSTVMLATQRTSPGVDRSLQESAQASGGQRRVSCSQFVRSL